MKAQVTTVGELRKALAHLPDNADILFRGHPIVIAQTTLDINPRKDGVSLSIGRDYMEIAPPSPENHFRDQQVPE